MGRELGRDPIVAVTGCVAQQEGDKLIKRSAGVIDVVVGTQQMKMLPMLATQALAERAAPAARARRAPKARIAIDNPYEEPSFPLGVMRRGDPVRAYVTIIEGCNDFCAFCVVPYTRGHERMRAKAEILADVREAVASGRREVQLLGQIVNHYQAPDDPSCDFPALLEAVHDVSGIERIRFASPHPRHTSDRADRRGARPAEGLQTSAPARAVRLDARARTDAAPAHARAVSGSRCTHSRGYPERAAIDRYDCWLPRGDGGRLRGDAVADRSRCATTASSPSSTRSGRTRWRRSGCRTT